MTMSRASAAALMLLAGAIAAPGALADELTEYGAYLSGECVTCHRMDRADSRIPSLAGLPREHILATLSAFKSGERPSPVMQDIAARLADDEISALAAYFSSAGSTIECRETQASANKQC